MSRAVDSLAALQRELSALFGGDTVDHVHWGVRFHSIRHDRTIYSLNPSHFMVPASNQKLLTAAVAAERLGWDYRFTTRLLATAAPDADGMIEGDLIVVSNGDPTINRRHPDRWDVFDRWAVALKARGIRAIQGRLLGDDSAFAEPALGMGWAWDNLQYGYGAPPSALQYNENQVEVIVMPGLSAGGRAIIATSPPGSGLVIDNQVTTVGEKEETFVDIARLPGTKSVTVRGQVGAEARPVTVTASIDDPTRFYLNALRDALWRQDIVFTHGSADLDTLEEPPSRERITELLVDTSPPLSEIIDVTMKWSRNIYAETLLLATSPPGEPASGVRGLRSMRETLEAWGIVPEAYLPRDGSGLSRYDYVSADMLTRLLIHMWNSPKHARTYESTLPVAGVSGLLATRMRGTPAEGRVRAKTGTLSNVRALSGYLSTLDGDTVVFSMMANNFRVGTAEIDRIMDAALNAVVRRRGGPSGPADQLPRSTGGSRDPEFRHRSEAFGIRRVRSAPTIGFFAQPGQHRFAIMREQRPER
jgi:D-alanyl-D-alanine carboxypeptidase/D-alanyl-D-alanine-endopeptidase (penicillin-binding protein 4)